MKKMPSIDYHISRSCSDAKTSKTLHTLLDMPPNIPFDPAIHSAHRKKTHNFQAAFAIGMVVGTEVGTPRKAIIDALQHLNDDLELTLFNNMMRSSRKSEGESEREEGDK